ncbi:MAG: laccase domain-containing protein, partial [Rhodoferax sp.]
MTHSTPEPSDWMRPAWPAPAHVRTLCTTRDGGVSLPPFDSLNLGMHVGDDADAVATNRKRLHSMVGAKPVFLNQVHGTHLLELDRNTPDG